MLARVRRQWGFVSRVPPRQVARRLWLFFLSRAEARVQPDLDRPAPTRRSAQPSAQFPPRTGLAKRTNDGWRVTFLGRTATLPRTVDWGGGDDQAGQQLWRMNLNYMEYLEELDDASFSDLLTQWIKSNPPYEPGSLHVSWNAYTLSIRVVVWMQQLTSRAGNLSDLLVAGAERSIVGQLRYLVRHLETDIGGNHLMKNVKALVWGSRYFEGPEAERWQLHGEMLLARELPRQMLRDGMHFERSPSYHCQVFADLLEIRHALGRDPLGGSLDNALRRAAEVISDLTHPDGKIAQFGDSGLTMAYLPASCLDAFKATFGDAPAARSSFALEQAGYYGMRHRADYFVVDAGPIAPPSLPAHGHGDMLSFEWSVAGCRIIVDPGVLEYVAGPRRVASRTAATHNTLVLEGMDQAEFFGAFRCGRRAQIELLRYEPGEAGFVLEARHDGFRRIFGGPLHTRRFTAAPGSVRIDDLLEPAARVAGRVSLLIHPSAATQEIEAGQWQLSCGKAAVFIKGSAALLAEPAVWWPDMGIERKTVRLVLPLEAGVGACWIELSAPRSRERDLA